VYLAAKGGVIALTKTLAREVVSKGVTVNCVCPGPTQTVLLDQLTEAGPKLRDSLARSIPLRRIAQPATSPRPLSSSPATTLRTSPGKRSRSAAA